MFGFSLTKLLVLALIIGAVWYGFKFLSRRQAAGAKPAGVNQGFAARFKRFKREKGAPMDAVEDMVQCPRCKAYIPEGSEHTCV